MYWLLQAITKQLAEILHFSLSFDEMKVRVYVCVCLFVCMCMVPSFFDGVCVACFPNYFKMYMVS